MKHVVNIAFDFEDSRVRQHLEETVEEQVKNELKQAVIDSIFQKRDWGRNSHADPANDQLKYWVQEMVKDIIAEHKDDICREAAKMIVESMNKNPKWKQKVLEEVSKL